MRHFCDIGLHNCNFLLDYNDLTQLCQNSRNELSEEMTPASQQLIKGAMEKVASSWLSALPIKTIGYALGQMWVTYLLGHMNCVLSLPGHKVH